MQLQTDQIITIAAVALTALATWFALRAALAAERSGVIQKQSHDLAAIGQFIRDVYAERDFTLAKAPKNEDGSEMKLRQAKTSARDQFEHNPNLWKSESHVSKETWQNTTAYETSIALETLGIAVFTGLVPLRLLLAEHADSIVDDWLFCVPWVESYRDREAAKSRVETTKSTNVQFYRRHAEWLAYVAALWIVDHWNYKWGHHLINENGGPAGVRTRIVELSRADRVLMPDIVHKDLKEIVNVIV